MRRLSAAARPLVFSIACGLSLSFPAWADVLLAPGDRISLVVIGARDLDAVAQVEIDGTVNLPVIGRLPAAGLSIDDLREDIAQALSLEPLRLSGPNDGGAWLQIVPSNVFVTIAEYRPVYVAGDVRNGGEKPFRPGMTARQALVIAGGIGFVVADAPNGDVPRLLTEREVLARRMAAAQADLKRLETELAAIEAGEAQAGASETMPLARDWLDARAALRDVNERSAELALEKMRERLTVLERLQEVTNETLTTYEEEFQRAQDLARRGVATANTVSEARRGLLSFSIQALETASEAYNLRLEITRATDRMEADQTSERVAALTAILDQVSRVQDLQAQLAAMDRRLSMLGETAFEAPPTALQVVIWRSGPEGVVRLEADLDTLVAPGDVVEIAQMVQSGQ